MLAKLLLLFEEVSKPSGWKSVGGSLKELPWIYFEVESPSLAEGEPLGTCFQYSEQDLREPSILGLRIWVCYLVNYTLVNHLIKQDWGRDRRRYLVGIHHEKSDVIIRSYSYITISLDFTSSIKCYNFHLVEIFKM